MLANLRISAPKRGTSMAPEARCRLLLASSQRPKQSLTALSEVLILLAHISRTLLRRHESVALSSSSFFAIQPTNHNPVNRWVRHQQLPAKALERLMNRLGCGLTEPTVSSRVLQFSNPPQVFWVRNQKWPLG
jgi:hypothetical protein